MRIILRPRGRPEEEDVRVCRELRFSLAIMPPSKVCPQCQASVPLKLKLCKCCQHVFQSKRKAEYSLSDQATKRMRVSKATKRASETSEQTLHRQRQDRKCKTSTRANETSEQSVHRKRDLPTPPGPLRNTWYGSTGLFAFNARTAFYTSHDGT
jgi:hypothetical protein